MENQKTSLIINQDIRKKLQMIKQRGDFNNVNEVITELIKLSGSNVIKNKEGVQEKK